MDQYKTTYSTSSERPVDSNSKKLLDVHKRDDEIQTTIDTFLANFSYTATRLDSYYQPYPTMDAHTSTHYDLLATSPNKWRDMHNPLHMLTQNRVSYLGTEKQWGWVRIMFENFNGIGMGLQDWKMDTLNQLSGNTK